MHTSQVAFFRQRFLLSKIMSCSKRANNLRIMIKKENNQSSDREELKKGKTDGSSEWSRTDGDSSNQRKPKWNPSETKVEGKGPGGTPTGNRMRGRIREHEAGVRPSP